MSTLRIQKVEVINSKEVVVIFSANLSSNFSLSNIKIVSSIEEVPDPKIYNLFVRNNELIIKCLPLTPLVKYYIVVSSLNSIISENPFLTFIEDGKNNRFGFVGPQDDNLFVNRLSDFLRGNIYDIDDKESLVYKNIWGLSQNFSNALHDIRKVKNENYITFDVVDEIKIRGSGPFDRLNEEGAYKLLRVSRTTADERLLKEIKIDSFNNFPISLQQEFKSSPLSISLSDELNSFNRRNVTITLDKNNVIKLSKLSFVTSSQTYNYNIDQLKYSLLENKYDLNNSYKLVSLKSNQIKVSDKIFNDIDISDVLSISIEYYYKNLGINVKSSSVRVFDIRESKREVLPPILNVFNLNHAPITNKDGEILELNGVSFRKVNDNSLSEEFLHEIPFKNANTPIMPGDYSIDYNTGTVYVYGSNETANGTGPTPPTATYNYSFDYQSQIDFVYDQDNLEIASLPNGKLRGNKCVVSFLYEENLINGEDFKEFINKESLNEEVGNNLVDLNAIKTKNRNVNQVFRIYNQTSGELYSINRVNNNIVYFNYRDPPRLEEVKGENSIFNLINNEILYIYSNEINSSSIRVISVNLDNKNILSKSDDNLGSFINSSLVLSDKEIFVRERFFSDNIDDLIFIGDYFVDYLNGILYCAVVNNQSYELGGAQYRHGVMNPVNKNIFSIENLKYSNSNNLNLLHYDFFTESEVNVLKFFPSISTGSLQYILLNNEVGKFETSFINELDEKATSVWGIYDLEDLTNNYTPINFVEASTHTPNTKNVLLSTLNKTFITNITNDLSVILDFSTHYLSSNISYNFSVRRLSDSTEFYDNSANIILGDKLEIELSGFNSPNIDDEVIVELNFSINNLSPIALNYSIGNILLDYTYVSDIIFISYEYGANSLDFRESTSVSEGEQYYVTYKAGALRNGLLNNFGSLINIPELTTFNVDFERDRYRDVIKGALGSFIQGASTSSISNLFEEVTKIKPNIREDLFNTWSLGSTPLSPSVIKTKSSYDKYNSKFYLGSLINKDELKLPISSNFKVNEGTYEQWIKMENDGIDLDAELNIKIYKNNVLIDRSFIFIGLEENHPESSIFNLHKKDVLIGTPNLNKDGVYIYYNKFNLNEWKISVVDGYTTNPSSYRIEINTSGKFYLFKSNNLIESSVISSSNNVKININNLSANTFEYNFLASEDSYIFDSCEYLNKNRLSFYKDSIGFLTFRAIDKFGEQYKIIHDVSNWKAGELHHVAASWVFNSFDSKDEMHLFVDGIEVPNVQSYNDEDLVDIKRWIEVSKEDVIGSFNNDIFRSSDLQTNAGSPNVTSLTNFSALNISIGDTINIDDPGFDPNGYIISNIIGQTLELNSPMPLTLSNLTFIINKTSIPLKDKSLFSNRFVLKTHDLIINSSDLSTNNNIATSSTDFIISNIKPGFYLRINDVRFDKIYIIKEVSQFSLTIVGNFPVNDTALSFDIFSNSFEELPGERSENPYYIRENNNLTLLNGINSNDLLISNNLGLNSKNVNKTYFSWSDGYENIIKTRLPSPIDLNSVNIQKIILENTFIGPNNSVVAGNLFTKNDFNYYQPSNILDIRTFSITISGNNIDWAVPTVVTITGLDQGGNPQTVVQNFSNYNTENTIDGLSEITNIEVSTTVINPLLNACVISIKEENSLQNQNVSNGAIIKYSYPINFGTTLYLSNISEVSDINNKFSYNNINNVIFINSLNSYYLITDVSEDKHTLTIELLPNSFPLSSFSDSYYEILDINTFSSGIQNGYFYFEQLNNPGQPFNIRNGFYKFNYYSNLKISLELGNKDLFLGSDINGKNYFKNVFDQLVVHSVKLTDTRVGETLNERKSITSIYNSIRPATEDKTTLQILSFDNDIINNKARFYSFNSNNYNISNISVNESFSPGIYFDKSSIIDNLGYISNDVGSIEFWLNNKYDTEHDKSIRYYFDAFSSVTEEIISSSNTLIPLKYRASQILSVKYNNKEYSAGHKLTFQASNSKQEIITSFNNKVVLSQDALQILNVFIKDDLSKRDYINSTILSNDKKTLFLQNFRLNNKDIIINYKPLVNNIVNNQLIYLRTPLTYQNTKVKVTYIPEGFFGDRISIYKDEFGFMTFRVFASGKEYTVRSRVVWKGGTWHRIKCTWNFTKNKLNLFVDGKNYDNILFDGTSTAQPYLDGYSSGPSINFNDTINNFSIGGNINKLNNSFSLISNFRISNIDRISVKFLNEKIDINYNNNLNVVEPVVNDLYTTYMLDVKNELLLIDNFAKVQDSNSFNFSVDAFDSLSYIGNNEKLKSLIVKILDLLKPANSVANVNFLT